jgi:predicted dinucleotide-binding enzyme
MEIGVIGINEFTKAFCNHWIKKGHQIYYADLNPYSVGYATAEELGPSVILALPSNVAKRAEIIVIAVPQKNLLAIAEAMGDVQEKIIIDLIEDDSEQGFRKEAKSSFDEIKELFPKAKVVKITSQFPRTTNTLFTYSNDRVAQRLVRWVTEGLNIKLIDLQENKIVL